MSYPFGTYLHVWIGDYGLGELVRKLLCNPWQYARLAVSPSRMDWHVKVFWPLCFTPFAAPMVMAVPAATWFQLLMIHHSVLQPIRIHWLAPMVPTIFAAGIMGTKRLSDLLERHNRHSLSRGLAIAPAVACALSVVTPSSLVQNSSARPTHNPEVAYITSAYSPALFHMSAEDEAAWRAIAAVPAAASVAASGDLMAPLSGRKTLYEYNFDLPYRDGHIRDYLDADYLAIHARCESDGAGIYAWPGIMHLRTQMLGLLASGRWDPVFVEGNSLVMRQVRQGEANAGRVDAAQRHVRDAWSDERVAQRPGARMDLGRAAYEKGDLETAAAHYVAAARLSPHDGYPCRKAGQALWQLGRLGEAVQYFGMAVERAPFCYDARLTLADALRNLKQFDVAESEYRQAIALLPTEAAPYVNLGALYLACGRKREARRELRRALRLDPTFAEAKRLLGRCEAGGR